MKITEFKELVAKRQMLLNLKEDERDEFMKEEYSMQIEEIDEKLFGSFEYGTQKLYKVFHVGGEFVKDILRKFFKHKGDYVKVDFMGYMLDLELVIDNKYYNLGSYDRNQSLLCLYGKANPGWEAVLKDYPELKDFLWREFETLKISSKLSEKTLIQKKLAERNAERAFLQNPESVQKRIGELNEEVSGLENKLKEISESLSDINIE